MVTLTMCYSFKKYYCLYKMFKSTTIIAYEISSEHIRYLLSFNYVPLVWQSGINVQISQRNSLLDYRSVYKIDSHLFSKPLQWCKKCVPLGYYDTDTVETECSICSSQLNAICYLQETRI